MYGTVTSVEIRLAGSWLLGDHAIGVTTLQVADVSDLPDAGGLVLVAGDLLAFIDITDTSDPDATAVNDTITLAAATVTAYPANAVVALDPARPYKLALVVLDGDDEAVECLVAHALFDRLAEGPRQLALGETVHVEFRTGDALPLVDDVLGQAPSVDAGYITPGTLQSSAIDQAEFVESGVIPLLMNASGGASGGGGGFLLNIHLDESTGGIVFEEILP